MTYISLKSYFFLAGIFLIINNTLQGMVYDNRYFPFYLKPFVRRCEQSLFLRFQPMFMRADRAQGALDDVGLPEIDGHYDQVDIAQALQVANIINENPFRSDFRGLTSIAYKREGRLDAEGIAVFLEQALLPHMWFGASFLFMHVTMRHEFFLDSRCLPNLPLGDRNYLFSLKGQMHDALGVTPPLYNTTDVADGDVYLRFGSTWDYMYKFRHIDAGLKIGALVPLAASRCIDNPASIPLGGNKHWGVYAAFDIDFEVKEDWHAGFLLRFNKRFERTSLQRVPAVMVSVQKPDDQVSMFIAHEPTGYGAIRGFFGVNPGLTSIFAPYVLLEDIRDGFGFGVQYTLVKHQADCFSDKRLIKQFPEKLDFSEVSNRSGWGAEYVSLTAFYDASKHHECRWWLPTIGVSWDMPTDWAISKRVSKTHNVSLMLDVRF